MTDHLLASIAHLLAGANWQRGGGKGKKPKPIKPPAVRRGSQRDRREDGMRRMRNLGLLPGHAKPPPRPLTPQEQVLLAAIEREQQRKADQPTD